MRLEFARAALADLDSIYRHGLAEFGGAQAEVYAESLASTFRLICEFPAIAPLHPARTDGLRRRSTGVHSIYFTIDDECIRLVRILDQRMDPERHL